MNASEHYQRAEQLLRSTDKPRMTSTSITWNYQEAQVHAALAQAAATERLVDLLTAWKSDVDSVPQPDLTSLARTIAGNLARAERMHQL